MGYKKVLATLGIVLFMGTGSAYADKVPVEFMQWSEFKKLIPITRDITLENSVVVEDVETGALFRVISTAGVYHADIESLTAEDAAIRASLFKKGSWKRPVLIHVKGKVVAASIYGEPHCGLDNVPVGEKGHDLSGDRYGVNDENLDAVKGNNEDGVMCIHVRGCINHFNKQTDSTSQKNIDSIVGKYPDGVEYKGDAKTSSGSIGNGSSSDSTTTEDTNPEANVGELLKSSDDFITGKLIAGQKKLPVRDGVKRNIVNGSPPSGSYYFSDDGYLVGPAKGGGASTDSLKGSSNLFNNILQGKERAVVKEMQDLQKGKFATTEITGDLYGTNDFWTYDLSKLYKNKFASNFKISNGKTEYTIYIPRGADDEGNQINGAIIGATIRSIKMYKEAVLQGMYGGMVVTSYNLFSMYPTVQLPMTDVVDITKIDKNNVRPLKSTTRMKYSLDYYYHPVLGKMSADDIDINDAGWSSKWATIGYVSNGSGKLSFTLDDEYREFMNGTDPLRQGAVQMKDAILSKSNGMRGYTLSHTNDKSEPASLVGTLFRVAVPKQFEKSLGSNKYQIKEDTGYTILEDVRLSITHARVYVGKEGDLKVGGDYTNFGIDEKGLAFYKTTVDGKTVGAVIPLWYNEAVYDPYEDKLYYTGRPIRFDNDYVGKIEFKRANVELLAAVEKAGGNRRITIQEFAFGEGKDYLKYEDHENIGNEPDVFDINITFEGHLTGKPNDNHSVNGGAESDIVGDGVSDDSGVATDTTIAKIDVPTYKNANITPNYGMPSLASIVYADDDSIYDEDYADYYEDIVVTDDYESYSIPDEGSVSLLSRINPFSRANTGANASDANKDWGHGVTASDLKKLSANRYKGQEELIIKVANVYKVNPALMLSIMMTENGGSSPLLNRANNCGSNSWFSGCGYPKDDVNSKWIKFPTLEEGINYLGAYLSRVYVSKGLTTLEAMGKKYCPYTYKDWANKINANYKKITGKSWTASAAGTGISGIMQIDIASINSASSSANNNSSSNSNSSTNTDNSGNVEVVNTDEVFNGFTIVRNNVYLQEPTLLSWLDSKEARAMVNVESDELKEKILGNANMSNQMLTYKEWERMQDIRSELDRENGLNNKLLKWTRLLTMVFGFSLIFYSMLLIFAYYIDIFNALLDISLLSMMTFGRYYPISSKEDINYLGPPSDGQKYVNIGQLMGVVFIGLLVGSFFVLATPILELIATMYLKIKGVIGGI